MRTITAIILSTIVLSGVSEARRLKAYLYPKEIAPGQFGLIIIENPNYDKVISRAKCDAEKLVAWTKDEVPILRIEQKGKQIFTSLGSYQSMGDSAIAIFMTPVALDPGQATLYVVNDHDASVPYNFTITDKPACSLKKIVGGSIQPLHTFTVVGDGFQPSQQLDTKVPIHALDMNIGYSKLSAAEQYTALNKRMAIDWAQIPTGDFLAIDQGKKHWDIFVESCGVDKEGATLDFIAPPDLTSGPATLTLTTRYNTATYCKSAPLNVTVQ